MVRSLSESLRRMTPKKDVVEALTAELLSTAQELLAIAEPSADAPNLEEGDDIMFDHLLGADERRNFDKYSETIEELKKHCKEKNMDFEKILDDALNSAIIHEDAEKLADEIMEKIEDNGPSRGNKSKLRDYIKDEITKNLAEKFLKKKSVAGSFNGGKEGQKKTGASSNKKKNNNYGEGTDKEGQKFIEYYRKLIESIIENYSDIRSSTYFNKKSFYRNVIEKVIEDIEKNQGNYNNTGGEFKNKDELLKDLENFCRDVISKLREKEKNQSSYKPQFFSEDLIHKNFSKGCPLGDIVIDDDKPVSESFRQQMEGVEEQIAKITGESTRTQGTTPGGEETILNAKFGIHTRMKQIFMSFSSDVEGTTSSKLTSGAEHYKLPPISALGRVSGIPLPGRQPVASYSVVVLDTSGSISEGDLSSYVIPSICSLFASNSTNIIIIQYDADLQRECLIEPEQRHNLMKALESYKGRGGTAMESALLYVYRKFIERKINEKIEFKELKDKISYNKVNAFLAQNRQQPDKVVMITDGVTGYDHPEIKEWPPNVPLIILKFYEHGNWPKKIPHYRVDMSDLANITYSRYDPRGQAMSL